MLIHKSQTILIGRIYFDQWHREHIWISRLCFAMGLCAIYTEAVQERITWFACRSITWASDSCTNYLSTSFVQTWDPDVWRAQKVNGALATKLWFGVQFVFLDIFVHNLKTFRLIYKELISSVKYFCFLGGGLTFRYFTYFKSPFHFLLGNFVFAPVSINLLIT